jgi:hypothetical protein
VLCRFQNGKVLVDGVNIQLPYKHLNGVNIRQVSSSLIRMSTGRGVDAIYTKGHMEIQVNQDYKNKVSQIDGKEVEGFRFIQGLGCKIALNVVG